MSTGILLLEGRLYKGSPYSVGYDLYSTQTVTLWPGKRLKIKTGVRTSLPKAVVGVIGDRSGLADDYGLTVLAGIIDPDYTKEWKVVLLNTGDEAVVINAGDRIAQVLFMNTLQAVSIPEGAPASITYAETERTGGFGSTGK